VESPGENENLNEAPQGAMRLLVLLNHNSPLKTAITFLTRRGYEITIVHDVNEFLKILFELKPHMTLISWNQKNANVRNIHEMITNKFKIDCVILAENATTNSAAALMSSGLPHFVLPPVSGPSIRFT
jgi:DNA-binding NtrC family response regulator